jgi:hypothetical protein
MDSIVYQCIQQVKLQVHLSYEKDIFIDFTAGEGLFISGVIERLAGRSLFYDVNNSKGHPHILIYDFLNPTFNFAIFDKTYLAGLWYDDIHVIGCPPADKVARSIEVASTFAQSISFLLPNKPHYAFPLSYKRLCSIDVPGKNMIFQIWLKSDY